MLPSLPPELIVDIFAHLDLQSILRCIQVCHLLHDIISQTPSLRYLILLAVHGQEDGCLSGLPTEQLANGLSVYASQWDNLNFGAEYNIPMRKGDYWELYGNVLAQTLPKTSRIEFHQTAAYARGVKPTTWYVDVNFDFRAARECEFGIDPGQDLLVVVENTHWRRGFVPAEEAGYLFHMRHIVTGRDHPQATLRPPFVRIPSREPDPHVFFFIRIAGDFLGVSVKYLTDALDELRIWNWKTGVLHLHLTGEANEIRSFTFLSETHVIIAIEPAGFDDQPHLKIIAFDEPKPTPARAAHWRTQYILALDLPPLRYNLTLGDLRLDCEASPTWRPAPELYVPFFSNPRAHVCVVTILMANGRDGCTIAVPLDTFQTHLRQVKPGESVRLAWGLWGPRGSRILEPDCRLFADWNIDIRVYGTRYVTPGRTRDGEGFLAVYDFNQLAARKAACAVEGSSLPLHEGGIEVVHQPSISSLRMFKRPITTQLPYRRVLLPLPVEARLDGLLVSEDGLLLLVDGAFVVIAV